MKKIIRLGSYSGIVLLSACSYLPFFGKDDKPGPLPALQATLQPRLVWQYNTGASGKAGFVPAVMSQNVLVATPSGTVSKLNAQNGNLQWQTETRQKLSTGVGAGKNHLAVGTTKGDLFIFDSAGKTLSQPKASSEIVSPPNVTDDSVIALTGDGKIFSFTSSDGKRKWVEQRATPPLIVRNYAGGLLIRDMLIVGLPAGKMLVLEQNSGTVNWEATISIPKGATELERITDVTSLPASDERQACAVAYQGRVACFDLQQGSLNWSRELSSVHGLVLDNRNLYLTDDKGAVHALDKATGASVWKQDKLALRRVGAPQLFGEEYLALIDVEGYVHLLNRADGNMVGRRETDGSAATSQPVKLGSGIVFQTMRGNAFHFTP